MAATIESILFQFENIAFLVIDLLLVLGTVVFLWGVVRYVTAGGDSEKVAEGRNLIIFGIIGLAVMVSVWGIVWLVADTFDLGGEPIPRVPSELP